MKTQAQYQALIATRLKNIKRLKAQHRTAILCNPQPLETLKRIRKLLREENKLLRKLRREFRDLVHDELF